MYPLGLQHQLTALILLFQSLLRNSVAEFLEHSLMKLPRCLQMNKLHQYFEQQKNNRANPAMSDALLRPGQVAGAERHDYNVMLGAGVTSKSSAGMEEMATREVVLCCRLL